MYHQFPVRLPHQYPPMGAAPHMNMPQQQYWPPPPPMPPTAPPYMTGYAGNGNGGGMMQPRAPRAPMAVQTQWSKTTKHGGIEIIETTEDGVMSLEAKVKVPVEDFPDFNFIGRLLGPRGMTVKQIEQHTGTRIMIRGQGSVKNEERERHLKGREGWEHLDEPLYVSVVAQERNRSEAYAKLDVAAKMVRELLTPVNNDELKRRQLMELAIINGTYRPMVTLKSKPPIRRFRRHDRDRMLVTVPTTTTAEPTTNTTNV